MNASPLIEVTDSQIWAKDESGAIFSSQTILGRAPFYISTGIIRQAVLFKHATLGIPTKIFRNPCIGPWYFWLLMFFSSRIQNQVFTTFPLLLDENNQIAQLFGVWGEKKFMEKLKTGFTAPAS